MTNLSIIKAINPYYSLIAFVLVLSALIIFAYSAVTTSRNVKKESLRDRLAAGMVLLGIVIVVIDLILPQSNNTKKTLQSKSPAELESELLELRKKQDSIQEIFYYDSVKTSKRHSIGMFPDQDEEPVIRIRTTSSKKEKNEIQE